MRDTINYDALSNLNVFQSHLSHFILCSSEFTKILNSIDRPVVDDSDVVDFASVRNVLDKELMRTVYPFHW